MIEPWIAQTLRNYLFKVGHRARPVCCTQKQIDALKNAGLIHTDANGVIRFEGQELGVEPGDLLPGEPPGPAPPPEPPPKYDADAAAEARDKAIAQVDAAAEEEWRETAFAAVEIVARRTSLFICDAVWQQLEKMTLFVPREQRAMGPVMLRAASAKFIESTGVYGKSTRVTSHGVTRVEWRSLIYGELAP